MPEAVPTQIGPYRIQEKLGEGGMGQVYKARDTRLNRPVAIKFLSDELADAAARRRFQREAQTASSLNHPHIVTVHDVGEIEGRQYIVTEFIDGGTLRDWTRQEKRDWRQVVELLTGVADGLAAAHEAKILHRDIKPANILITKSGYAKLADFGLAKLEEDANVPAPDDSTLTLTERPTKPGVVIGTIAYMSPEQASGLKLDARSDIFSFGTVLYELLSGRRPFAGKTDLETLQKVIHGTPQPLGEEVPAALRVAIEKALEKDPGERYQSMREMVVDLRRLTRQSAAERVPSHWRWASAALAPLLLIAGLFAWRPWSDPVAPEPLRAVPFTTLRGVQRYPSFSPSGNHVAFTWTGPRQDNTDIYVQQIGTGSPLRLTDDPAAEYNPVWSPDDRWIAFLRPLRETGRSELRLIPPLGGQERKLAEIRISGGINVIPPHLAWCPESDCLVVTDSSGEGEPDALFVVSLETGEKRQLTHPPRTAGDSNPAVSPDGRWLVLRRNPNALYTGQLYALALGRGLTSAGEPRRLTLPVLDAAYPAWMPGSEEIVFSAPTLFGSLWRLTVTGERAPARLPFVGEYGLMPVVSRPQPGRPSRLVYVHRFQDVNIWRVETSAPGVAASSPPVPAIASTRADGMPHFSPDGQRVAFWADRSGESEIWLADSDGANPVQLTFLGPGVRGYPHWSPDGEMVAFHSAVEGQWDVFVTPAGGGKPRNLTAHPAHDSFGSFSRDGRWVYFSSTRTGEWRVWKMPSSGGDAIRLTDSEGYAPQESPDGAYLYYVQTIDAPSALWRMPASGGVPEKLLDGVVLANFAVLDRGIYYIDRPSEQADVHYLDIPGGETRLLYFDFATRKSTIVARNLGPVDVPLTVSPDGRTILYPRLDSSVDDLMLVENFR